MKIDIAIQLDCDDDFGELGDFQWELKNRIKNEILHNIMKHTKTIDFINKKVEEVLKGELNV